MSLQRLAATSEAHVPKVCAPHPFSITRERLHSNDDPAQPKTKNQNFKILYAHLIRRHLGERVNDLGEKMNGPSEEYMIQ